MPAEDTPAAEPPVAGKPLSPPYGATPWDTEKIAPKPPRVPKPEEKPEGPHVTPVPPVTEAPVEPPPEPDDGRSYFISFVDMPWEDVVHHYAKLVGKPAEVHEGGDA